MRYLVGFETCSTYKLNLVYDLLPSILKQLKIDGLGAMLIVTQLEKEQDYLGITVEHRPDVYVVAIKTNVDEREMARVLAHEIVHVKQMLTGNLVQKVVKGVPTTTVMWKGKKFDVDKVEWIRRPWEREAVMLGELLLQTYSSKFKVHE